MNHHTTVLRLGHRHDRDARITTHIGLVARAWGVDQLIISGDHDTAVLKTIESVNSRFGGTISAKWEHSPMGWLRKFVNGELQKQKEKGIAIHLTMYGLPVDEKLATISKKQPTVFVVGGPKVPSDIWEICQYHISIGSQPHSEVAALAIALDRWGARPDDVDTSNALMKIHPSENGKQVSEIEK